jgi:hypothetical protein
MRHIATLLIAVCAFAFLAWPVSGASAADFQYVARTEDTARQQGSVNASGLVWTCRDNRCVISGPWTKPGVTACRNLATKVGRIRSYGRDGAMLSREGLRSCNNTSTFQASTSVASAEADELDVGPIRGPAAEEWTPIDVAQPIQIVEATTAIALSSRSVTTPSGDPAQRYELTYSVTVENRSSTTRYFRILTEIAGSVRDRSGHFVIGGEQSVRKTIRFSFDLELLGIALTGFLTPGGNPVNIILAGNEGTEYDRVARRVDLTRVDTGPTPPSARNDLRVYRLRVVTQAPYDPDNRTKDWSTKATIRIENTGTAYWDDAASVTVTYARGQSEPLTPIEGVAVITKPIPPGIRQGEYVQIELRLPRALRSQRWYTATARLNSPDDEIAENNLRTFVFYRY